MEAAGKSEFITHCDVSRETLERLEIYAALLEKWNPTINLVSRSTIGDLWSRHFLDSAQIFDLIPEEAYRCLDLGSGGGFPGLVLAILSQEKNPARQVTLVESDLRKSAFLQTVAREVGLGTEIKACRIEALEPFGADVMTARALAPLSTLLNFAKMHLAYGGEAIFLKGANHRAEIEAAAEKRQFQCEIVESITDPNAVILKIGAISDV